MMTTLHRPSRLDGRDHEEPASSARMVSRPLAILIASGALLGGVLIGGIVGGFSASEAVERSLVLMEENDELKEQNALLDNDDESTDDD